MKRYLTDFFEVYTWSFVVWLQCVFSLLFLVHGAFGWATFALVVAILLRVKDLR